LVSKEPAGLPQELLVLLRFSTLEHVARVLDLLLTPSLNEMQPGAGRYPWYKLLLTSCLDGLSHVRSAVGLAHNLLVLDQVQNPLVKLARNWSRFLAGRISFESVDVFELQLLMCRTIGYLLNYHEVIFFLLGILNLVRLQRASTFLDRFGSELHGSQVSADLVRAYIQVPDFFFYVRN